MGSSPIRDTKKEKMPDIRVGDFVRVLNSKDKGIVSRVDGKYVRINPTNRPTLLVTKRKNVVRM